MENFKSATIKELFKNNQIKVDELIDLEFTAITIKITYKNKEHTIEYLNNEDMTEVEVAHNYHYDFFYNDDEISSNELMHIKEDLETIANESFGDKSYIYEKAIEEIESKYNNQVRVDNNRIIAFNEKTNEELIVSKAEIWSIRHAISGCYQEEIQDFLNKS